VAAPDITLLRDTRHGRDAGQIQTVASQLVELARQAQPSLRRTDGAQGSMEWAR
jgi:hypothetical protein